MNEVVIHPLANSHAKGNFEIHILSIENTSVFHPMILQQNVQINLKTIRFLYWPVKHLDIVGQRWVFEASAIE